MTRNCFCFCWLVFQIGGESEMDREAIADVVASQGIPKRFRIERQGMREWNEFQTNHSRYCFLLRNPETVQSQHPVSVIP